LSRSLTISEGGYFLITQILSNYRALWVKIKVRKAFGYISYPTMPFITRRVKCNNPLVVQRFNSLYKSFLHKHNLFQRIFNIQIAIDRGIWNENLIQDEKIRSLRKEGILFADKRYKRLYLGEVL